MTKKVNETNEAVNEKVNKSVDKSIKLEIVKNLGNYETVRLGIEIELNGSNAKRAFRAAKKKLDYSFEKLFSNENNLLKPNLNNVNNVNSTSVNNTSVNNVKKLRRFPQPDTSEFQQLVKAVKNKLIEIEEVVHNYEISKEEFNFFKKCIDY